MDYNMLVKQCSSLLEGEAHPLPALANTAALLFENMEALNWAGFYLLESGSLMLGPFQGKAACIRIPVGKGVCGTAAALDRAVLVEDVHQFPGHIACDSNSSAELVLPIHYGGQVIGVLDLDSPVKSRFTEADRAGLQGIVDLLENKVDWERWQL
ncbi:MAG: GAF domain-containing protein [Firmicutes bacterium]|nr:GAF domain-containing protein [Bacillota bacterium]